MKSLRRKNQETMKLELHHGFFEWISWCSPSCSSLKTRCFGTSKEIKVSDEDKVCHHMNHERETFLTKCSSASFFRKQSKKKSGFLTFYRLWTVCSKRAHVSDLKTSKNYVENEVTDPGVACRMRTSPKSNRKAFVDQKCKWVFIILMFHLKKGNKRKMKVVKKIMLCMFRVVYRLGCFSVDDNTLHVMLDWRTSGQRTSLVFLPHLLHVFQEQ